MPPQHQGFTEGLDRNITILVYVCVWMWVSLTPLCYSTVVVWRKGRWHLSAVWRLPCAARWGVKVKVAPNSFPHRPNSTTPLQASLLLSAREQQCCVRESLWFLLFTVWSNTSHLAKILWPAALHHPQDLTQLVSPLNQMTNCHTHTHRVIEERI